MSTYQCRDCGHPYGSTPPSAPVIALHRAVSHGGATPVVAVTLPAGITSREPMPYGYRRWNGAVWADSQTDAYNRELVRILSRHDAGMDTQALVDGLYNLARGFDYPETSAGIACPHCGVDLAPEDAAHIERCQLGLK